MSGREQTQQETDKYQRRLNELYRTRKDIVESIKDLKRRQRLTADKKHVQQHHTARENEGRPSAEELPKSQQNLDHPHLDTQQEDIKKVVEAQSNLKDRNRRLLGGLNKHLQKAESRLSEQLSKVRSKQSIEEKVLQKERQQAQQFEEQKKRQMETELQKLNLAKENNSKEMLATENIILKNKFIAYVSDLEQCLFTQTLPSLAWKPNPQAHSADLLKKLQQNSNEKLKKSSDVVLQQVSSYSQPFDFNTYRMENEREFYANYLDNYFSSKQHFIATMTQPSLLWLPNQHNQNTSKQLLASNQSKAQLRQSIVQECDAFYKRFEKEAAIVEDHSEASESEH